MRSLPLAKLSEGDDKVGANLPYHGGLLPGPAQDLVLLYTSSGSPGSPSTAQRAHGAVPPQRVAGGPAGDQPRPASSRPSWPRVTQRGGAGHGTGEGLGPPGGVGNLHLPNACASAGGTQHPYACASSGGTSASPKRDIAPALEGWCLQWHPGKRLGKHQRGGDPRYLLETRFVSLALNRETSTSTKLSSLIQTHRNNHPPCDK